MKAHLQYGAFLALLLSISSFLGSTPHTLRALPWAVELLYFPLVLYLAIRSVGRRRPGGAMTLREGFRVGVMVSLHAALLFGSVLLLLSFYYFSLITLSMSVWVVLTTVGETLGLGCLASYLCSASLVKRQSA